MRVLITRPDPDGVDFAEACRKVGLTPLLAPLMTISYADKSIDLEDVGALAFTSANGVRAFARLSAQRDLPVFAVGRVTAAVASELGFSNVLVADGDLPSLARLAAENAAKINGALFHGAGADRAGDLIKLLENTNIKARRETLYKAEAAKALPDAARNALVDTKPLEWATFFSPRTALLFSNLVADAGLQDRLTNTHAVCLSDAVAEALSKDAWKAVSVVSRRDANAVIEHITA